MPATTGTNWGVEPIHSLDYRWHLSTAIDKFLRPHCPPPCNPDVGIWELNKQDGNAIFIVWAQLSLLMENAKLDPQNPEGISFAPDSSTNVQSVCPWERLNRLQNLLTFAPSVVSMEKNMGLVTGYTINGQIFLAPWAAPSASFRNHLATAGLGTVEAAVVDRMGVCARGLENKSEVSMTMEKPRQWMNVSGSPMPTFTIYTGEGFRYKIPSAELLKRNTKEELHLYDITGQRIGTSSWIGLEDDKVTIYGILMGNAVQPITYRFRVATDAQSPDGVTFSVHVAGSNPLLPPIYNHRVIMRFGMENGQRWTGGHSLADRWRLVSALDAFLRPQCATDSTCKENMDVLLLTFNYQANGFTVIWSEKSLLMKKSNEPSTNPAAQFDPIRENWTKRSKRQSIPYAAQHHERSRLKLNLGSANVSSYRYPEHFQRIARSGGSTLSEMAIACPEKDIIYLERRLLGDTGFGLLPLPELAHHLKASGVGFLKEVQVERLGPCAKSIGVPVKVHSVSDRGGPNGEIYPTGVSSYGPVQSKDRQRLILLGTILPVCVCVICILLGILGFVWYRKRGKQGDSRLDLNSKLVSQSHNMNNPETEQMLKQETEPFRQTDMALNNRDQSGTLPTRTQTNGSGPRALNYPEVVESNCTPPTKPLILPNERPPLKPPEYNLAYTDSPATSPPQFHNGTPQMAASAFPTLLNSNVVAGPGPRLASKPYYGTRPNPYRNLPPPIETKPGMPLLAAQMPYAPYKRVTGMRPDMSHTLPR
ncbi:unnamed protein product [Echinostoma caproni]|uniref:Protein kinase domain-containing protein n=1 Tax=Echinostoma caproni TaxID=27848 RepID=A0A183AD27_9TREM|nr:unnamed protein product [Echinostoma caproni]